MHSTDRASRVATVPLFHACRRHYPGGAGRCERRPLPDRWQPSPIFRRVGLRVARFEACSAFTRVAARMVAEPPRAARYTEVLQSKSLPPSTAPSATGWSDICRAGFAPAEGRRLSTAHRIQWANCLVPFVLRSFPTSNRPPTQDTCSSCVQLDFTNGYLIQASHDGCRPRVYQRAATIGCTHGRRVQTGQRQHQSN